MPKEKRRFQRYHKEVSFKLTINGKVYEAKTEDYSVDGLRVCVSADAPVKTGDMVNLDIEKIHVKSGGRIMRISPRSGGRICLGISRLGMLHGSLEDFQTSDVLLGLQRSVKTGVTYFKSGNVQKVVYFKSGDMIFATSNLVEDRLGDMLMREGRITLDQYNGSSEVLKSEVQKQDDKRHGAVLVEMGFIKPKELFSVVKRSVELIILSIFSMRSGDFLFKEGELPTDEVITLQLSAANLIYRGVKAIDDISTIKSMCPAADDKITFSSDPLNLFQDLQFDEMDKKVLALVDGTKTFKETVDSSGLEPFEAMRLISALLCTRIIEVLDLGQSADISPEDISYGEIFKEHHEEQARQAARPAAVEKPSSTGSAAEPTPEDAIKVAALEKKRSDEMIRKVNEMYAICEEHDYYSVLGVDKRAMSGQVKRAYYMRAKEFHPDKHYTLPLSIMEKLNTIFTTITTAYSTLSSPDLKIQYDRDPMKGRSRVVDPAERAEQKFEEASTLMRKGRYDEAASTFAEAAYLQNEMPNYHYFSGLALSRAGKHKEAERTMQRAIKLDPFNAEYLAELGHVYLALGFNLRAKGSFEKALKLSAMHKRAMQGLAALPDE